MRIASLARRCMACGAELCRFVCLQSDLWRRVSDKPWAHRPDNARRRVPRGHRLGSALCRSRAFRPRPHPHRLAQRRLTGLGQGALVLADHKTIENPFFLLYADWAQLPMVVLATAAT